MSNVTVKPGQSLWTIAKKSLPTGAPDVDVQKAVAQIAAASGISPSAGLQVGQRLTIPDAFVGLSTSPAAGDALARLSTTTTPSASGLSTRLGASARPLLDFKHALVEVPKRALGEVALPSIAGKEVRGEVHQFDGVKTYLGEAALKTTTGVLGKLTKDEFDAVHRELGGRSPVKHDAEKSYTVKDFLPAALQLLVDRDLDMGDAVELKGSKKIIEALGEDGGLYRPDNDLKVALSMNCHAAAYEAVRAYQGNDDEVALFYGEMITMDGLVEGGQIFDKVGDVSVEDVKAGQLAKLHALDLKPGDVVQFHEVTDWARMTMLLHSAVYVGGGLFFEKPNTEGAEKDDEASYTRQEETPFRLATLEDMAKPLHDFVDGSYRVEVLRAKTELADPKEHFGSSMEEHVSKWAEKKGRALGAELVVELEQGSGGGILAEHVSALVRIGIEIDDDGEVTIEE